MTRNNRIVMLTAGAVLAFGAGCETTPVEDAIPIVIQAPMEHDPTHEVVTVGWWSDGVQLLRLGADGGFERFATLNRYRAPVERGRWTQDGYAVLWLEPYDSRTPERIRVSIRRAGESLTIVRPRFAPMFPIAAPPPMIEDRLFGSWIAPAGELQLNADGTYWFSPAAMATVGNLVAVGHRGRWRTEERAVVLQPMPRGDGPFRLDVVSEDDAWRLVAPDGSFVRGE